METKETQEIQYEDQLCSDIANLTAALTNLEEIDTGLMNKTKAQKVVRMKRRIFDLLYYYCECLPQLTEDEEN